MSTIVPLLLLMRRHHECLHAEPANTLMFLMLHCMQAAHL